MTTTTDQVAEQLAEAFKHWRAIPRPVDIMDLYLLRTTYSSQNGSHWFDDKTLRFFGSRLHDMTVEAPGIVVECQRKAPEGVPRYAVTAFVQDEDYTIPRIATCLIGRFAVRRDAAKFARKAHQVMMHT